ncbi:MAG: dioxygenase [Acidianus sp.]|jgi:aromatic ring-opening dioxygenase catalytic subunit (LigB family)|nr:dioxygenase [Acidianus sp.]
MKGYYISHGSPLLLIEENKWKETLRNLGKKIRKEIGPEIAIIISPHFFSWNGKFLIETQEKLECIQDYYGFPEETYKYCYSAENDTDTVNNLLSTGLFTPDNNWGLDHGAWIPLYYMFPEGIKVVAISINDRPVEEHYKLGEVIAKVVNKRAIIIGTGSPTHRLDLYYFKVVPKESKFDTKLKDLLSKGDFDSIMKLEGTKEWKEAQPEGLLRPLYIVMGAVKPKKASIIDYSIPWPGVSMIAVEFSDQ